MIQTLMIEKDLAAILRPGNEITTILDRKYIIGAIHPDQKWEGQYWIEPEGADDFDWWIPVSKVVRVNGKEIQSSNPTNSSNSQT